MKIASVVGARPQFIKCAPLSREIRKHHREILVHTGQHYDPDLSAVFFEDLRIPEPDYHLEVGSGSHGYQTGQILIRTEEVLIREEPDLVIVYGDTNSTLAGALAAAKLHIPVGHVEAGLRSFDRAMPEEINRVVADHLAGLLFCPTGTAEQNLKREGITRNVHLTGDVMKDVLEFNRELAAERSRILDRFDLTPGDYLVTTIHRPSNTDQRENLAAIISALSRSGMQVVFPVHPRTRKYLQEYGFWTAMPENILCINPIGYLDMIRLMTGAGKILTDSGGIQKEAYLLGVPCITLRDTTEWVETVQDGWNVLVGADEARILSAIRTFTPVQTQRNVFGETGASGRIAAIIDGWVP